MKKTLGIVFMGLFVAISFLIAEDTADLDKSEYFEGKEKYSYQDGFVDFYLPQGYSLETEEVESRSYIDYNNNMQFDPAHTDTYLETGDGRFILDRTGGDIVTTSGDFTAISKKFVTAFLAKYVFEKEGNEQDYKPVGEIKQTELDYGMKMEGKLSASFGAVKLIRFISEAFTYENKPYIGITYLERKIFSDKTAYNNFHRHVALFSKGILVVAKVNIFNNEKNTDWETAFKAIAPVLNGVLPTIPAEDTELEADIIGTWKSSSYTSTGNTYDENSISVSTSRKIVFSAGGKYSQTGFTGLSGAVYGGAQFSGTKGTYKIYGKRLVLKSDSGGILTYFIDKQEDNFFTLDGESYIRDK